VLDKDIVVEGGDVAQDNAASVCCLVCVGENGRGNKGVHHGEHGVFHGASSIEMPSMAYDRLRGKYRMRSIWPHDHVKK
jgi:hypothetical protein